MTDPIITTLNEGWRPPADQAEGVLEVLLHRVNELELQAQRTVPTVHVTYEEGEAGMTALGNPFDPLPQEFVVIVDQHGEHSRAMGWASPYSVF